jgi:hypothetical protein
MSSITTEQLDILNQFKCERLTKQDKNKLLLENFSNSKNIEIVKILREDAWEEDKNNQIVYYLVKHNDDIALFFAIKCGGLFTPFNEITDGIKNSKIKDKCKDKCSHINYVHSSYPGIEIVYFCANESFREKWKTLKIGNHPMGKVLFWHFFPDIIENILEIIGCEYLFLFAADSTDDRLLVAYYKVDLKFEEPNLIATNKPLFDFECIFLSQKIEDLQKNKEEFFNNFNQDFKNIEN